MKEIIHLTPEAEPREFHGLTEDFEAQSAHLSFEVLPEGEPDLMTADDLARRRFENFLGSVSKSVFFVVDIPAKTAFDPVNAVALPAWIEVPRTFVAKTPVPDMLDWLDRNRALYHDAGGGHFYLSKGSDGRKVADMRNATAVEYLRGTARIPAPLAQNAGLMTVLKVPKVSEVGARQLLIVLPEGEAPTSVSVTENSPVIGAEPALLDVVVSSDKAETFRFRTSELQPFDKETLGRLFQPDGSFLIDGSADTFQRLARRVEERAATLLWPATVLGSIAAAEINAGTHEWAERELVWLAQASALTMFDIAIVGLVLPVSNGQLITRRSGVIERYTRLLAGYFEAQDIGLDVDETVLYQKLHSAIKAKIDSTTLEDVVITLEQLFADDSLEVLIQAVKGTIEAKDGKEAWLERLAGDLGRVALMLESEEGAETWLTKVLDEAVNPSEKPTLYEGLSKDEDKLSEIYNAFIADIKGEFDAAEVLRREFGVEALAAALPPVPKNTAPTPQERADALREAILTSAALQRRFVKPADAETSAVFDRLWDACYRIPIEIDHNEVANSLSQRLKTFMIPRLETLVREENTNLLFRPDAAPKPLMLPIADDPGSFNPDGEGAFGAQTSGIGFLVQSAPGLLEGDTKENLVHASVIGLRLASFGEDEALVDVIARTVDPTLPSAPPGSEGLFLPYHGAPLSTPGHVTPDGGQSASDAELERRIQQGALFQKIEAAYNEDQKVPELAYGFSYRVSGFWVPPSGVLPVELRQGGDVFLPQPPENKNSGFVPKYKGWPCQRRTQIGEMKLSAAEQGKELAPIPENVHPISSDDPRLVVLRYPDRRIHVDIFRVGDGSGALEWTEKEVDGETIIEGPTEVVLAEADIPSGAIATLRAQLMNVDALQDFSYESPLDRNMAGASYDEATSKLTLRLPEHLVGRYWLRLWFEKGTAVALSFAEPGNEAGQDNAERAAPTLLLAPKSGDDWRIENTRKIKVSAPQVSFSDLERWAANNKRWAETCGDEAKTEEEGVRTKPQELIAKLRLARTILAAVGDTREALFNALPDPAVRRLDIHLGFADKMQGDRPDTIARSESVLIAPYEIDHSSFPIDVKEEEFDPGEGTPFDTSNLWKLLNKCAKLAEDIRKRADVALLITSDSEAANSDGALKITLPEGTAWGMHILPAVAKDLFEADETSIAIFDPRMKQLAVGMDVDVVFFGGPRLNIEVAAHQPAEIKLHNLLRITHMGSARGYHVDAHPKENLRIYSQIELLTQRFRFSGPPINNWISPIPDDGGPPIVSPVVEVYSKSEKQKDEEPGERTPETVQKSGQDGVRLKRFEDDLFIGRDDSDADRKLVRIRPATEVSRLDTFEWPERSATYLRHRPKMISRYSGIAPSNHRSFEAKVWTSRCAIRADAGAGAIARPQFRAFIPVHDSPRAGRKGGPTPVTCVLSEPPFPQLGLADRFCATLALTERFEFPDMDENPPKLRLAKLRKQISPDPRLSYYPVREDISRKASIIAEGPAGLSFDAPGTAAPAWSNSQYLLHVDVPRDETGATEHELEESYLGIQLSRLSDPDWCWSAPPKEEPTYEPLKADTWFDPNLGFWLSDTKPLEEVDLPLEDPKDPKDAKILKHPGDVVFSATPVPGGYSVKARGDTLYPDADSQIEIWHGRLDGIVVKPLGDRRLRVSLFARTTDVPNTTAVAADEAIPSGGLSLLATVVLTLPEEVYALGKALNLKDKSVIGPAKGKTVVQSETTLTEWARSSRDLSHLIKNPRQPEEGPLKVEALEPKLTVINVIEDGEGEVLDLGFAAVDGGFLTVSPPLSTRRYPLHEHRRLVFLTRKSSRQLGHQIDLFEQAALADGNGVVRLLDTQATSLVLAEVATRAEILVTNDADPGFAFATFDLLASQDDKRDFRQLRFHLRAANRKLPLAGTKFRMDSATIGTTSADFEWALPDGAEDVHSLDCILYAGSDDEPVIVWTLWRDAEGKLKRDVTTAKNEDGANIEWATIAHRQRETLALSCTIQEHDPVWLDISMLQSVKNFDQLRPGEFDFDWVFGPAPDGSESEYPALSMNPEVAVSHQALNALPDVQMRIIGLTDPIPFPQTK